MLMNDLPEDVYLTVVAYCRGYGRRRRYLASAGAGVIRDYSEFVNQAIDRAVSESCDRWLAPHMVRCIAEYVGFNRFPLNHQISKASYYEQKRASVLAIARAFHLL